MGKQEGLEKVQFPFRFAPYMPWPVAFNRARTGPSLSPRHPRPAGPRLLRRHHSSLIAPCTQINICALTSSIGLACLTDRQASPMASQLVGQEDSLSVPENNLEQAIEGYGCTFTAEPT